jgi:hypothetical protein
MTDLKLAD